MKTRTILLGIAVLAMASLATESFSAWAQDEKKDLPYTGAVAEESVNLRSGPGLNFEILKKADKDELILVIEEAYGWCKITLPRKSNAYIHSDYLITLNKLAAKVKADKVNIRAGASTTFNVIGQLNKDDLVEIIAAENDWYRIYPRDNCYAWIHKDFVQKKGAASIYLKPEKQLQTPLDLLLEAETFESEQYSKQEEIKQENKEITDTAAESAEVKEEQPAEAKSAKPVPAIDTAAILQKYQLIVRDYPESEEAKIAEEHLARIKSNLPIDGGEKSGERSSAKMLTPPPDQAPAASGKIMDMGRLFKRKGTHKLIDQNKKTIYYLSSESLNLNDYIYRQVEIWGAISNPDDKIPTITVDFIKKLD